MCYNKYNAWRKKVANDDNDYVASDAKVKVYLTELAKDDVARKMLGLRMLNDGIIDKNLMDMLVLKQLERYF